MQKKNRIKIELGTRLHFYNFSQYKDLLYASYLSNQFLNFEIFRKDFDRYYAQFEIRDIIWGSVYAMKPQTIQTTDRQLFKLLSDIVVNINGLIDYRRLMHRRRIINLLTGKE
jgi:hypothetical protein